MFISFAAFQTLIRLLIYCLAGFNQLVPNIDAFPLFISVSLSSVCRHGFLSLFSNQVGRVLCVKVCVCVGMRVG